MSFAVKAGQLCALLGPNGAGKSTLHALLYRLLIPDHGSIDIAGHALNENPRTALARIGIVFQQPTFDLDLTVQQNMRYFAALQGISGLHAEDRIDVALDRLEMRERDHKETRALNGGHRRRTEIARALIHQPDILLLDEPTVGPHAAARQAITKAGGKDEQPCETFIVPGLCGMVLLFNGMQSSFSLVYDCEMGSMRLLLTSPWPAGSC